MTKKAKKPDYPCSVCGKNVNNNHLAIECTHCNFWSHNKCNNIDKKQYRDYQLNSELSFYCMKCKEDFIPFMKLNDHEFNSIVKKGEIFPQININFTNFTPSLSQQEMFDKLNNEIEEYNIRVINEETDSVYDHPLTCNYYGVEEFSSCKFESS